MLHGAGKLVETKTHFNVDDVGYASAAAAGLVVAILLLLVHLLEPNKVLVL